MDERRREDVSERIGDHAVQDRRVDDHHRSRDAGHADCHQREQFAPRHVLEIRLDHEGRFDHSEEYGCR